MMILSQMVGDYSQTLRIGQKNEVEVRIGGKLMFNGEATNIIDNGNKLSFKDKEGKQYEFIKYLSMTWA